MLWLDGSQTEVEDEDIDVVGCATSSSSADGITKTNPMPSIYIPSVSKGPDEATGGHLGSPPASPTGPDHQQLLVRILPGTPTSFD